MKIQIFKNQLGNIRVVMIKGEPWFVGKDIANALGYADTFGALKKHVGEEDKQNCQNDSFESNRGLTVINESGLFSLTLSSKLPTAKKFKHWVTSEVLPSIRKHGIYAVDDLLNNPDFAIKALQALKAEREEKQMLQTRIEADKPYSDFGKAISQTEKGILVGDFAKILKSNGIDIGQNRLFAWLRDHGYLIKEGNRRNTPCQKYLNMKLFTVKEKVIHRTLGNEVVLTTRITGKGQIYITEKLKTALENKKHSEQTG